MSGNGCHFHDIEPLFEEPTGRLVPEIMESQILNFCPFAGFFKRLGDAVRVFQSPDRSIGSRSGESVFAMMASSSPGSSLRSRAGDGLGRRTERTGLESDSIPHSFLAIVKRCEMIASSRRIEAGLFPSLRRTSRYAAISDPRIVAITWEERG